MRNFFRNIQIIPATLLLSWLTITLGAPQSALKAGLLSAFLLIVPGYLALRVFFRNIWDNRPAELIAYSVAFSLFILMIAGLAVNTVLPFFHIGEPLSTQPLTLAITSLIATFMGILFARQEAVLPALTRRWPQPRTIALATLGALIPVLGAAGAITLNNGGSNLLALTALGLIGVYFLALIWRKDARHHHLFPFALYAISLALLLSNSLRGWHITGHDIIQEYQVFQLTSTHGYWTMNLLHDAYMACLSITILPTVITRLTGISDPYVYKVLMQFVFALVPMTLFMTMNRLVAKRLAFLAAFVFVSFPTFITDMSMLNRQEIAFLFLTLALMTLLDSRLSRSVKSSLIMILGTGMIVSHYSTSYVAISVILLAKILETPNGWLQRFFLKSRRITSYPLSWPVVLALVLTAYLWNSQITNTSQGITRTITGIVQSLPHILSFTTKSGESSYSLVGKSLSDAEIFQNYAASGQEGRDLSASEYYPDALTSQYPAATAHETVEPLTPTGQWITDHLRLPLYHTYELLRTGYAGLVQLLIVIGLLILTFSGRLRRIPVQYRLLGVASFAMVALQVLLPSSVIDYGLLRLIQQSLLFLALPVVIACDIVLRWLRLPEGWHLRVMSVGFVIFFAILSGFAPALTGGFKPALATSNTGFYYEAYYTHDDEIAGYDWLKNSTPTGSIVDADEFARRKMITYAGIYARTAVLPEAIARDAYVYLSHGDTTFDAIPVYYHGSLVYQQPPTDFLEANKDLVYSNGNVRIYR